MDTAPRRAALQCRPDKITNKAEPLWRGATAPDRSADQNSYDPPPSGVFEGAERGSGATGGRAGADSIGKSAAAVTHDATGRSPDRCVYGRRREGQPTQSSLASASQAGRRARHEPRTPRGLLSGCIGLIWLPGGGSPQTPPPQTTLAHGGADVRGLTQPARGGVARSRARSQVARKPSR